ncbi:MAG: chloride channel protein [Planctomycetes bacterium]|nr:chloride channel protein [Planctomycetota bacterium]
MNLAGRLRRLSAKLGFERDWYLIFLAAVIGTLTAFVALAFMATIHYLEDTADNLSQEAMKWMIPLVPMGGALLAGIIVYYLANEARGHGVPEVMHAIHRNKSRIKLRVAIAKWLSAICTIGSGGSAGAEGPIVQIGSSVGSKFGQLLKINPQNTATLLGCGAAAGIASVFNAPIAGIFFVLEILLRDFSLRTFTPIVIASVFSAVVTQSMLGESPALFAVAADFNVGAFTAIEIPNYLLLGVVCGLIAMAFIKSLYWTEDLYDKFKLHPILKPVTGAALLGLMGFIYVLMKKGDLEIPPFFSNGYPVIRELLGHEYYASDQASAVFLAIIALCGLKILATCLTIGSGGSGGVFAPSLLLGAGVGGAFGVLVDALDWFTHANPAHYALVGMAAVVAATTHAPLTAILIVYEITGSYQIILPVMLAAVFSTIVSQLISRKSIYTLKLARRGVRIGAMSDLTILRRLSVEDVPNAMVSPVIVHSNDSAQHLLDLSKQQSVSDFVVVDEQDHYVGLVTAADLKEALLYSEAIPLLQVNELQRVDLPTVTADETLDRVLDKFSRYDVNSLAVLEDNGEGLVRGLITRDRLMQKYQQELDKD